MNEAIGALVAQGVPRESFSWQGQRSGTTARSGGSGAAEQPVTKYLPSEADLDRADSRFWESEDLRRDFQEWSGLDEDALYDLEVGWDPKKRAYWLPVRFEDELAAVIRRKFRSLPKSATWKPEPGSYVYAPLGFDPSQPVIVAAGEHDYFRLWALGFNVVCFTNGESSCPPADRLGELSGSDLVLLYDNDKDGKPEKVASALFPHVHSASVAQWPEDIPTGYDATDTLDDEKFGSVFIEKAIANAIPWEKEQAEGFALSTEVQQRVSRLQIEHQAKLEFNALLVEQRAALSKKVRNTTGVDFFLDIPEIPPVLWGEGKRILWIDGEPLMICGDDGTGKSTLGHQLLACRLGIRKSLLGYDVAPAEGLVVYLAMDRPEQARRAGARMFPKDFHKKVRKNLSQLAVWNGPLPVDVLRSPEVLADWLQGEFGPFISEVHADSLKDISARLSDEAVGSGINSAIQEVISRGINWVGLHHQRKSNNENKTPTSLADVYGSRWLTAGQGSVLMLVRAGNDKDMVELKQLKEPMDKTPSILVQHDRNSGRSRAIEAKKELEQVLRAYPDGVSARQVAAEMYGKPIEKVSSTEQTRVTRQLDARVRNEKASRTPGQRGGVGGSKPALYMLLEEEDD
jgi:hypothetical protein